MAGIKDTKIIKGQPHLLTYITPNEVEKLKALGGQETMTPEGIPAYPEYDNYGFSSQSDFNSGDVSRSNDPNVRGEGPGQNRVTASQLAATNAKEKADAIAKDIAKRELEKSKYDVGTKKNPYADFFSKQKIKSMNKAARRNKYKTLQELNQLPKDELSKSQLAFMAMNPIYGFGKLISGQTKVNPETDMFDIDSIREIGGQTQYTPTVDPVTGKTTYGTTANQAKQLGYLKQDIDMSTRKDITQNEFDEYMNRKKIPTFESGGNPNILPQYAMMGGGADMGSEDVEPYNQFTYDEDAFGLGGDSADVTRASYDFNQGGRAGKAEGGIMELRARRAFGGIMDRVDKRQGYFLGGIGKAIKGVVGGVADAAGKVLKSDVGKMAIAGAAFYYGGGGSGMFAQGSAGGGGWMGGLKAMGGNFMSSANPLLFSGGKLSLGKLGLASAALPFLMPAAKPNETSFSDRGGSLIDPITGLPAKPAEMRASLNNALDNADGDPIRIKQINDAYAFLGPDERLGTYSPYRTYGVKDGGRIGKAEGGLLDLGGMEKDYRAEGGFVPIGEYEKKDDVPARLSVNEFVFTADAVRGAGQGDIDKGAEIMENMMKNLEKGGTISEESQGNIGAQQMFETSERLGEVI